MRSLLLALSLLDLARHAAMRARFAIAAPYRPVPSGPARVWFLDRA